MMKTTLTTLVLIATIGATTTVWAERGRTMSAAAKVERMANHLGLDAAQQQAVLELMEAERAQREADRAAGIVVDRQTLRARFESQLEQVLSADQFAQFTVRHDAGRKRGGDRVPRS